jgi:hypothetical protein
MGGAEELVGSRLTSFWHGRAACVLVVHKLTWITCASCILVRVKPSSERLKCMHIHRGLHLISVRQPLQTR